MIGPDLLARVTVAAVIPEQILPYVRAVSGRIPRLIGNCVGFASEGELVLVGYPLHDPRDTVAMEEAVSEALTSRRPGRLTVIGPARPSAAPVESHVTEDWYYSLPVPPPSPTQKLRNLIRRASRDLTIERGHECGEDHLTLVQRYLVERPLAAGTRLIFQKLPDYLAASPGSLLLSGRLADGTLAAFVVGDFSALQTAFFMFCFRDPRFAPPGSTDLLLAGLLEEAHKRGQTLMNLGLGIDDGIAFFKRKWGAIAFLPYVEVSWVTTRPRRSKKDPLLTDGDGMRREVVGGGGESFREPGIWETLRERFLGVRRLLDCLQVEVSSRCPGRCRYCPHTVMKEQWQGRDMEMATFTRLWPLMRRSSRVHLQGWGEPLLNPAFFEMTALARKAGSAVSTTTCGLIMNEELAEKLVESGLDIIAFSLAGVDVATNASREGVAFERVCEAISVLQAVRRARQGVHLEIHLAYLLFASNIAAVRGLPALMQRLGVHAAVISTLDYLPCASLKPESFSLDEPDKLAEAASILRETGSEVRRLGMDFFWSLPDPGAPGTSCRENIARSLFVAADGSVSPCVYLNLPVADDTNRNRIFGNVLTQEPLAIWESDQFRRFREALAEGNPDRTCLACVKRYER